MKLTTGRLTAALSLAAMAATSSGSRGELQIDEP